MWWLGRPLEILLVKVEARRFYSSLGPGRKERLNNESIGQEMCKSKKRREVTRVFQKNDRDERVSE